MTDFLCPTCGPINEDDGLLVGPGDAVCCAFCGCVEEEMVPLVDAYNAVVRKRDQAYADIAELVKKAADSHLAGYRELGSRAAEAETARDNAVQQAQMWAQEARTQKAIVRETGELVGCENDWEMVGAVRKMLQRQQAQGVKVLSEDGAYTYTVNDAGQCISIQIEDEDGEITDQVFKAPTAPAAVPDDFHNYIAGIRSLLRSGDWRTAANRSMIEDQVSKLERCILDAAPAEPEDIHLTRQTAQTLLEAGSDYCDEGPAGYGWQSDRLSKAVAELEAQLADTDSTDVDDQRAALFKAHNGAED